MTPYQSSLPFLTTDSAEPEAAAMLVDVAASTGFVPNMYQAMANSPGLLATYLDGYQRFRSGSGLSSAEQEVVFLAISEYYGCAYCVAAHSFIGDHISKTPLAVTEAIRNHSPIPDERLGALASFVGTMLSTAGRPSTAAVDVFRSAGFTERHVLEVILAIAVKTISNWTNHVFDTPLDDVFESRAWSAPTQP